MEAAARNMLDPVRPDYRGGGITNLMSSLVRGLGGDNGTYPPLTLLPPDEVAGAHNVVLLIIDGLGYHYLQRQGKMLSAYLRGSLSTVFPTSTAPAITTFLTGTGPQQHAVTGWFMHLRELGTVAKLLPFQPRWGGNSFAKENIRAEALIARPSVFERLDAEGHFIIEKRLVDMSYTIAGAGRAERIGYSDLRGCFTAIHRLVRRKRGRRKYIYAYWPYLDTLTHHHGVESAVVATHFRELETALAAFLESLRGTDTLIVVSADHGLIDTTPEDVVWLGAHPELQDCLALPLCGEPRAAYCYLRPGRVERFRQYVSECLSDRCELYASEDLIHQGWFGFGEPEPRLRERIGDFVLIAKGRTVIKDTVFGEEVWADTGVHGGLSEEELRVPLMVARC